MILTENDLVCVVEDIDDQDFLPIEYLQLKEGIISKEFLYYSVDNKTINIISSFGADCFGFDNFFSNLVYGKTLHLVDTMHGVMSNCSVESIEIVSLFEEALELNIVVHAGDIIPWEDELEIECYNIDAKYQGLLNNKKVKTLGKEALKVKGVSFASDYSFRENLNDNTIGYSIKINKNGTANVKQMFHFENRSIKDPSDYNIINNLKGKINFNKINDNNQVTFTIGDINFGISDTKIDQISHVFDMIELPIDFERENSIIYRLYYSGRLFV